MAERDFHNIEKMIPVDNGIYTWKSKFLGKIKVRYDHGEWFLLSNSDRLPDNVVRWWR